MARTVTLTVIGTVSLELPDHFAPTRGEIEEATVADLVDSVRLKARMRENVASISRRPMLPAALVTTASFAASVVAEHGERVAS